MDKKGYIYILTNQNKTTLYIGVTSDLCRRIAEHKLHLNKGFSDKYNAELLLYYENFDLVVDAIAREKQLKKWNREWKNELISEFNPSWEDLSENIGVDDAFLKSIKDAYDSGVLW